MRIGDLVSPFTQYVLVYSQYKAAVATNKYEIPTFTSCVVHIDQSQLGSSKDFGLLKNSAKLELPESHI